MLEIREFSIVLVTGNNTAKNVLKAFKNLGNFMVG